MGGNETKPCHLDKPFRQHGDLSAWTIEERDALRNDALEAEPYKKCDFDKYNMLLLGPRRAGKSSFINAIKSAFVGEVCYQSATGHEIANVTRNFKVTPIRGKDGESLGNFRFVDMPGLDYLSLDTETIGGILDGNLKHLEPHLTMLAAESVEENIIHCIVIVLDGTKAASVEIENPICRVLCDWRKQARARGIPVAVVLTHVDLVCTCFEKDLSKVFNCRSVESTILSVANPLEIDPCRVFVIQNYHGVQDVGVNVKIDCLMLATLKHLLQYCREYADNWLDAHEL